METYAQVLNYAVPVFFLLILLEAIVAKRLGMVVNRGADTISSLSSGITNALKDVLGLSIAIISYSWLLDHVALFTIEATWMVYFVAFLAKDFAGYWYHRMEHEVNIFWNQHIIHHSSEEFNLSCALRQSISAIVSFFALFLLPAAVFGVPAKVIAIIAPLHLFAQFWYHTRIIGKMGMLEAVLVTPSHHRVHHAMNAEYLDKNYGQILIIWDKLFGTFQPERSDVPPVYGVKRPVKTWNPILINFQHFWLLLLDAWHTRRWWDKMRIWFMPTGWRPDDVAEKYPVASVEDISQFQKYDSQPGPFVLYYAWAQLIFTLIMMFLLFHQIATIGLPGMFLYGCFLFVSVYSFTTALDRHRHALWIEGIRFLMGMVLIWLQGGVWYGLDLKGTLLVGTWLLTSLVMLGILQKTTKRKLATSPILEAPSSRMPS